MDTEPMVNEAPAVMKANGSRTVDASGWCRFNVSELIVAPDVAGASNRVCLDGHFVEIRLPGVPLDISLETNRLGNDKIWCPAWKDSKPLYFYVASIDVVVDLKKKVRVPAQALQSVNTSLFDEAARKQLDPLVVRATALADQAFDRWIRTLRWKTLNSAVGQVEPAELASGWGTYLLESQTTKRFYRSPAVFIVPAAHPISKEQWRSVGRSLARGAVPPVWFDFLFEGEHRVRTGDLHGGIVCLAIACESTLRTLLRHHLKRPASDTFLSMLNHLSVSGIIDRWKDLGFWDPEWQASTDLPRLKRLFEMRNGVVHRGTKPLDRDECNRVAKATRAFIVHAAATAQRLSQ